MSGNTNNIKLEIKYLISACVKIDLKWKRLIAAQVFMNFDVLV